ncbi:unnamed protein product, partial [marine sediment metagenome]
MITGVSEVILLDKCALSACLNLVALCLVLLATGASAAPQPQENVIDVQHDAKRGVTCYLLNGVGISCIPDSQLQAGNQ